MRQPPKERHAMTLHIGIVGFGNIGNTHAGVYDEREETDVAAICDINPELADEGAARFDAEPFYSVDEMLESDIDLDACSVTTAGEENGSLHYEPTMKLLAADLPVLGEKPISNDIEEAEEMVARAEERELPYGINLNHRFTPAARRAKEWLDEGRLGQPHMINMRMWINNPTESSPWFHLRALHPHSFDVIRYFCGDIARVQTFLMKGDGREIWSNAQINLEFENGAIGHLVGSYDAGASYGLEQCDVVGSEGRFVLEDACEELTYYPRDSIATETYDYLGGMQSFGETFASRIGVWIDQLVADDPYDEFEASGRDGLRAQQVIEAAIESFKTDSIVEVR